MILFVGRKNNNKQSERGNIICITILLIGTSRLAWVPSYVCEIMPPKKNIVAVIHHSSVPILMAYAMHGQSSNQSLETADNELNQKRQKTHYNRHITIITAHVAYHAYRAESLLLNIHTTIVVWLYTVGIYIYACILNEPVNHSRRRHTSIIHMLILVYGMNRTSIESNVHMKRPFNR